VPPTPSFSTDPNFTPDPSGTQPVAASSSSGTDTALIIVIVLVCVFGGVALCAALAGLMICCRNSRRNKKLPPAVGGPKPNETELERRRRELEEMGHVFPPATIIHDSRYQPAQHSGSGTPESGYPQSIQGGNYPTGGYAPSSVQSGAAPFGHSNSVNAYPGYGVPYPSHTPPPPSVVGGGSGAESYGHSPPPSVASDVAPSVMIPQQPYVLSSPEHNRQTVVMPGYPSERDVAAYPPTSEVRNNESMASMRTIV
jgi:hypothetical protein